MSQFIYSYKGISPKIDVTAFIAPSSSIVGDVKIGADSNIWYNCALRGDEEVIRIGERSNIQDGTVIHITEGVSGTHIGDDVTVGHSALLHACVIEDHGFVGMQSCLLDGSKVESFGMLAAGSLLTPHKVVPSGELWSGRPACFMRKLTNEDIENIKNSAPHYVQLGQEHKIEIEKRRC